MCRLLCTRCFSFISLILPHLFKFSESSGQGTTTEKESTTSQQNSDLPIPIQSGSGSSHLADFASGFADLATSTNLHQIAELVVKSLVPAALTQFQNYNLSPPAQVITENPDTRPQLTFGISHQKDDLNDSFDEAHLLKTVPVKFRRLGQILLKEFNGQANQITWTPDGSLLIDEVSIPKSNIFVIFPLLFKAAKPRYHVPGFDELLLKLDEMGLTHLIKSKRSKGLGQKLTSAQSKSNSNLPKQNSKWWYIGP